MGPTLIGVVPASAVKFYVYGNAKTFWAGKLDHRVEDHNFAVDALAAMSAGFAQSTAISPIWVVKTRLQLDRGEGGKRRYPNSWDCAKQIVKYEGVRGLYKGLSASYLGTAETVVHLGLYEQFKLVFRRMLGESRQGDRWQKWDGLKEWTSTSGASGLAKLAAILLTYPHEVRPRCFRVHSFLANT